MTLYSKKKAPSPCHCAMTDEVTAFAPAKLNLALHVTGQRDDGYHLLDSLVGFASVGDCIRVRRSRQTRISVSGPFGAQVPTDGRNLVAKAAALLDVCAEIHIEKNLPVASGIGGGSADAAAAIRALTTLFNIPVPGRDAILTLGADVPVCMLEDAARMQGIGDHLTPMGGLSGSLILVNPGDAVSTASVFAGLASKTNPGLGFPMPDTFENSWVDWLARQRNDLETPACAEAPIIAQVLDTLRDCDGCLLARMSGSGATCFALMTDDTARDRAAAYISRHNPDWWVAPCDFWAGLPDKCRIIS